MIYFNPLKSGGILLILLNYNSEYRHCTRIFEKKKQYSSFNAHKKCYSFICETISSKSLLSLNIFNILATLLLKVLNKTSIEIKKNVAKLEDMLFKYYLLFTKTIFHVFR